jgi:hypothetical protein
MGLPLSLGDVTFFGFEVPEQIGPLGGKQVLCVHDFPGGARTIQSLGAFPKVISWSGKLTGPNALSRLQQIDRMRAAGDNIVLTWGPQAFSGVIAEFDPKPQSQWLVEYSITFQPDADLSGVGVIDQLVAALEVALGGDVSAIAGIQQGDSGLACPEPLLAPSVLFTATVQAGLLAGNGTVAGIPRTNAVAIDVGAVAVQVAAAPLIASTDATEASPAIDMAAYATLATLTVGAPGQPATVLRTVNPNLYAIAQQYLGDATLWEEIALASGLPLDPQPIGQVTLLLPA